MGYDQNSFLQGIAVGKSLKGWSCGIGTSVPKCWNDEGKYTYFYIDYHLPISGVSLPIFKLSTRVLSEQGEIEVLGVESVDSNTFKVYCDLTKAKNGWVAVTGYNSMWLYYDNGYSVPEYASVFWIDSQQPYTFGYIEDSEALKVSKPTGVVEISTAYPEGIKFDAADAFSMPTLNRKMKYAETLSVNVSYVADPDTPPDE